MPELPEVQTVVSTLENQIKGQRITKVKVYWPKILANKSNQEFEQRLVGEKFTSFSRRGKYLIFTMSSCVMVAHMRMEGKFYRYMQETLPDKHTHIVFQLDQGELHYNDVRKFGRFWLYEKGEELSALSSLGYEPWDEELSAMALKKYNIGNKTPIKTQLLDQGMICGIGNIYADEICGKVKISPLQPAGLISLNQWEEIIQATREILAKAIEAGGTTIRDYTSSLGVTGRFQLSLIVHDRENEQCYDCGSVIEKIKLHGRGTYFCPECQKMQATCIAITGTIGSGKSTVTKMIQKQGYSTISCDAVNKELLEKTEVKQALAEILHCDVTEINKKYLSQRIFSDKQIKKKVEELLHRQIGLQIKQWYQLHASEQVVFVEVPLLFETGWYKYFSANLLVTTSQETVIDRLKENRGMVREDALKVIAAQMSVDDKKQLADYIINNDSSLENLTKDVNQWLTQLIKMF